VSECELEGLLNKAVNITISLSPLGTFNNTIA